MKMRMKVVAVPKPVVRDEMTMANASAVEALATIISSRTTGLGTATAGILIFMGGYSSMCPRYGSPQYPTHLTLV